MPAKGSGVSTQPDSFDSVQEKTLVSWSAPSRPFIKRNREFFVPLISAATLFGAILFLIDGIMPVLLVVAVMFLIYVLGTVEPQKVEYEITTWGVKTSGMLHRWELLGNFWINERPGGQVLVIAKFQFPGKVEMVLDTEKKNEVIEILEKFLVHEERPSTVFDKASGWVANKLQW